MTLKPLFTKIYHDNLSEVKTSAKGSYQSPDWILVSYS